MSFPKPDTSTTRLVLMMGLLAGIAIIVANGAAKYQKSSDSSVKTTKE